MKERPDLIQELTFEIVMLVGVAQTISNRKIKLPKMCVFCGFYCPMHWQGQCLSRQSLQRVAPRQGLAQDGNPHELQALDGTVAEMVPTVFSDVKNHKTGTERLLAKLAKFKKPKNLVVTVLVVDVHPSSLQELKCTGILFITMWFTRTNQVCQNGKPPKTNEWSDKIFPNQTLCQVLQPSFRFDMSASIPLPLLGKWWRDHLPGIAALCRRIQKLSTISSWSESSWQFGQWLVQMNSKWKG